MKTILLIEDDPDIQHNLAFILEDEGFRVHTANHGQEALNLLRDGSPLPDAILLDLMMPVVDGYSFRAQQCQDVQLAAIPVLMMSAASQLDLTRLRLTSLECLRKPLDLDMLVEALERFWPPPGSPANDHLIISPPPEAN